MPSELIRIVIALLVGASVVVPLTCRGQADSSVYRPMPDHSCTIHGGASFVLPAGKDGSNFKNGAGFEAGGGFGWTAWKKEQRQPNMFLMFDYGYSHAEAKSNPTPPPSGTTASTHGSFGMLSTGLLVRFYEQRRVSFYLGGGFGWFRRNIDEQENEPPTLTHLGAATLENSTTNSGALDMRGGVNIQLKRLGGAMVFVGAHGYKGLAINHDTILVPITAGMRW